MDFDDALKALAPEIAEWSDAAQLEDALRHAPERRHYEDLAEEADQ